LIAFTIRVNSQKKFKNYIWIAILLSMHQHITYANELNIHTMNLNQKTIFKKLWRKNLQYANFRC
ncbi:hypothetical protein KKB18_02120, partial [bacterium]|nr:hypothetical protein [bacterium]